MRPQVKFLNDKLINRIVTEATTVLCTLGIEIHNEKHPLISEHTRRHLKMEHFLPGSVIDRANRSRWEQQGALTLNQRASQQEEKLIKSYEPPELREEIRKELIQLMNRETCRYDHDKLPGLP